MRVLLCLAASLFIGLPCAGGATEQGSAAKASPVKAEVLLLGTYHMGNPGLDMYNVEADDVLAPKRQAEIATLVDILARFEPTRIAIEAPAGSATVARDYAAYRAGTRELARNEVDQIGYRLAKRLGHEAVYPIDVGGEFPFARVQHFAKATGREAELQEVLDWVGERVKDQGAFLSRHSVLAALRRINADAYVQEDLAFHARMLHFNGNGDWAGADLNADWYRRNARIVAGLVALADAPQQRILVIYGSGHLGLMRQMLAADPTLRLRSLEEFVAP